MAFLSSTQAARYLNGSPDSTLITSLISAADALIAEFCGIPRYSATVAATMTSQTYTLYLPDRDGRGVSEDQQTLILPVKPVTSITSITEDSEWAWGAGDLVASSNYVLDGDAGEVHLYPTSSHGAWDTSFRTLKVVCVAGWATTPEPLVDAGARLVAALYNWRGKPGRSSLTQGQTTESFTVRDIPDDVKAMLGRYIMPGALL